MTIMLNVFVGGSLGPAIVKWRFKGIWAYIFGPIIGTVTGGFVYKLLTPTEKSFSEIVKRSG
ncbi:putative major intrinsic protein [Helianthus anomalus]